MILLVTVCRACQENKATGRRADTFMAAYLASEIAHRMVVPGGEVSLMTNFVG